MGELGRKGERDGRRREGGREREMESKMREEPFRTITTK